MEVVAARYVLLGGMALVGSGYTISMLDLHTLPHLMVRLWIWVSSIVTLPFPLPTLAGSPQ